MQKAAMDATLNSINVADPTDAGAEEAISAPGVTDQATEQKKRKAVDVDMADIDADTAADAKEAKKAEKKRRKSEGVAGSKAEVDEEAVEKKLKKEKKEKRKSEVLNAGNVPEEQVKPEKKKKKSKA